MIKRLKVLLLAGFATLFFTACGSSGSDDSTPPITVNLIGTWDYATWTTNSTCDGLLAQGVKIVDSLNGDISTIGNTLTQGTNFKLDSNQNCYIAPYEELTDRTYGLPSVMTADEYLALLRNVVAGDNTIKSIRVDSFNDINIIKVYEYTSGVIITEQMTR